MIELLALAAAWTVDVKSDPITDEKRATLSVGEGSQGLAVLCRPKGRFRLVMITDRMLFARYRIASVTIRFDQDPALEPRTWDIDGRSVVTEYDGKWPFSLDRLAKAKHMAIRASTSAGSDTLALELSNGDAVERFQQTCAAL